MIHDFKEDYLPVVITIHCDNLKSAEFACRDVARRIEEGQTSGNEGYMDWYIEEDY